MRSEWNIYELQDVCSRLSSGKGIRGKDITETGKYPVYGGNGIRGYTDTYNFDGECAIIGRQGANCGNVRFFRGKAYMTEHAVVVCANEKSDTRFLFYLLGRMQLGRLSGQSAQPGLAVKTLSVQEIQLPDLSTQRQVACLLGAIDDKIETNNAINKNLEEQAQAIFKAWFIDYEPFGGTMPNDWRNYKLSEFLPVITGKKNANVSSEKGIYPFFSCSQDIAWTDDYSFEGNSILVAGNGDFNVKFYNGKFEAYQRTYVLIPRNPQYTAWLYYAIKYSLNEITRAARGSVIKFITKGNLEDFTFSAPNIIQKMNIIYEFEHINEVIALYRKENLRLANLRDALLPRLMSGEIDVPKIEL